MMPDRASAHTWVEIHAIVLSPGERAPQVPADTRLVPLEMRVKGFLQQDAVIGDVVDIITPAGRTLCGTLSAINPAYTHTYGAPIPALTSIGSEVRAVLRARGEVQ